MFVKRFLGVCTAVVMLFSMSTSMGTGLFREAVEIYQSLLLSMTFGATII